MLIERASPGSVTQYEHLWVPLADGNRLAARVWIPSDAEENPVPAIFEFLPYRRRDGTRERDTRNHAYYAAHGYAGVRVDIRGTGDSTGVLEDEYLAQEQQDGLEVLRWIAAQPWCDGNVGMVGISWGGFNGLQIAAHAPPELKAVITLCSTDDRYADDIHYMDGCHLVDNFTWATSMLDNDALPPDPETVGDAWRDMWMERLQDGDFWLEPWLRHQRRDAYWKHGSVCEDYGAIRCPVFAIGGWADGYTRAVFRLLENLKVPRLGLIGPWSHTHPNTGDPGPAIGFLQEAVRFWDRWLKGIENGIMEEPMLRAWMQESAPPATAYRVRPGRWVGEPSWPAAGVTERRHALAPGRLLAGEGEASGSAPPDAAAEAPGEARVLRIRSPLSVGLQSGRWFPYAGAPDLPGDQAEADGGSLTFDGPPLEERLEILGAPEVDLDLASDRPVAMVAVRLLDVDLGGRATRVSYGMLNLTHRDGHEHPEPLEPGRRYRVRVQLQHVAQAFPPGHRLRIAVSSSYWPMAWPSPEPVTLSVYPESSALRLPVRPPRPEDEDVDVTSPAVGAPPLAVTTLEEGGNARRIHRDLESGETVLEVVMDIGRIRIDELDLEVAHRSVERYSHRGNDPTSARAEIETESELRRGAWRTRANSLTRLTADAERYYGYAELDAFEGETRVAARTWRFGIDRDHT